MALVGHISGSSQSNSVIGVSGSVIVANKPNSGFPGFPGTDTSFYVSGAIGNVDKSVFGGDVVISGSLKVAGAAVGDVVGPSGGVLDGEVVVFDGTTGKLIKGTGNAFINSLGDITGSNLVLNGNQISGSAGGNLYLGSSGNVTVVGDLTVGGNDIKDSGGNTSITLSNGNVVIPGDLTVNGTTITADVITITVEDPLIALGFTSGSIAAPDADRGWMGSNSLLNVAMIWDNSTGEFVVAKTGDDPNVTNVTINSYGDFHAQDIQGRIVSASLGFSGSHTALLDGTSAFIAGTGIQITSQSNGAVTVTNSSPGSSVPQYFTSTTAGTLYTTGSTAFSNNEAGITKPSDKGSDVFFYVSGSSGADKSLFGGDVVVSGSLDVKNGAAFSGNLLQMTGSIEATLGFSGSLTQLTDGTSYLIAGAGIQITSQSNGPVTITNSSPASSIAQYFSSTTAGALYTTGSTAFIGNESGIDAPSDKGSDVFFYVSGSKNGTNKTLFGGDVTTSGSLEIQGGALTSAIATTFNLLNDVVTDLTIANNLTGTINFGQGAGILNVGTNASNVKVGDGAIGGTVTIGCTNAGTTVIQSTETNVDGNITLGNLSTDTITFSGSIDNDVLPLNDAQYNLGSPAKRWANVYTGDLHLRNDRGNWTMIEEENYLTIRNNNTGKVFRLLMEEVLTK